jgi:hypothetical protein
MAPMRSVTQIGPNVGGSHSEALPGKPKRGRGWTFAAFRAWRERELPRAGYEIAAKVWRPESYAQAAGETEAIRRALKNWEPCFSGLAHTERAIYLTEVVNRLTAERIGRLLYLSDLFRSDPDYAEHQGKRLHRIVLTREASETLMEFARRHGIRVSVLCTESAADVTDARDHINHSHENPASIPEELR